jgi:hypothetical protein
MLNDVVIYAKTSLTIIVNVSLCSFDFIAWNGVSISAFSSIVIVEEEKEKEKKRVYKGVIRVEHIMQNTFLGVNKKERDLI